MVTPSDLTGFLDNKWFTGLQGMGYWLGVVLGSVLSLAILWYIWNILEHKLKITIFPVYGASATDLDKLKDSQEITDIHIDIGHPKHARGKDVKKNGVRQFSIMKNFLNPFSKKTIKEVPFEYRYPDGIWMIEPAKNIFIPVARPHASEYINIRVPETEMDLWQQVSEADIRRRTQDEDTMKRQFYAMIIIIIGAFVLAGIIIWLSMSFAGKSIDNVLQEVKPMTEALNNLANVKPPG